MTNKKKRARVKVIRPITNRNNEIRIKTAEINRMNRFSNTAATVSIVSGTLLTTISPLVGIASTVIAAGSAAYFLKRKFDKMKEARTLQHNQRDKMGL